MLDVVIQISRHITLIIFAVALFFIILVASFACVMFYCKKKIKVKQDNKSMKKISVVQIANVHNIGKRESQQDSFGVSDISNSSLCNEKGIFAVVADGMGGLTAGAEVSAIVTSAMIKQFSVASVEENVPAFLLDILTYANNEVRKYLDINGYSKSGSTVVAVIIKDGGLYFISVGDSRIYLYRGGALIQLNREHIYGNELDEKAARGEIGAEEARNDPQRNSLTSYIGMDELAQIDRNIRPVALMSGDRVLLMTDGIFTALSEEEISSFACLNAYDAAAGLEAAILYKARSNQDNFTCIIIEMG